MKYTALELLTLAGVETPEEKIGKFGVSIGGVVVNKPDHIINLQDAKDVEIIVAKEVYKATLDDRTEPSEEVKNALKVKGDKSRKDFEDKKGPKKEEQQTE